MTIFLQASATNARTTVPTVSPVTVIGDQIAALTAIYVAGVNAVMVRRRLQSAVSAYAAQLCSQYESWRFGEVVSLTALQARLLQFLPALDGKQDFIADILLVAEMTACLFDTQRLGVRLELLNSTPCPRFHVDRIAARVLVTYHGSGTEWLHEADLDRSALGHRQPPSVKADVCLDPSHIKQADTGDLVLFKGEGWDGNEGRGWVHRSPHNTGRRLLLTLDLPPQP